MRQKIVIVLVIFLFIGEIFLFIRNGDWRWYVDNPSLFFVLAVIALLGGFAAFLYFRQTKSAQYWIRVLFWGIFALVFTVMFIMLCSLPVKYGGHLMQTPMFLLTLLCMGIAAILLWYRFWKEVKRG
jgi:uncharacterized membrane protein HdeD (DUF308 family)